jgi:hypothetical protein
MRIDVVLLSLALAFSAPAVACGFCIEDRVAAVYDQATIEKAIKERRHVAFFEFEGGAKQRAIVNALEGAGAARGTAKVSDPDHACSVVYDPRRTDLGRMIAAAGRAGIALKALRVIDERGKLREP